MIMKSTGLRLRLANVWAEQTWTLADGFVPLAMDGMVGCVSRLWSEDGKLLATGTSKHMCRPNPGYEEERARAREMGLLPDGD